MLIFEHPFFEAARGLRQTRCGVAVNSTFFESLISVPIAIGISNDLEFHESAERRGEIVCRRIFFRSFFEAGSKKEQKMIRRKRYII